MGNKELGVADPVYDALRIRSGQSIAPDLGGGSTGAGGIENKIYVWHADGSTIDTFDADEAGLTLALAAAATGDTVWLPSIEITLTAAITIPTDVVVTAITGQAKLIFPSLVSAAITLSASSGIERIYISQTANDAQDLVTIAGPSSGTARIGECVISCVQSGAGDAVAIGGAAGTLEIEDSILTGQSTGGAGYAISATSGTIYHRFCVISALTGGADSNPFTATGGTGYVVGAQISTGAITVTSTSGATISGLTVGVLYAVETFNGPWNRGGHYANEYTYRVSNDGGTTWEPYVYLGRLYDGVMHLDLPTWALFAEVASTNYARIYFVATTTSIKIRVAEDGVPWTDNTGSLSWRLSSATYNTAIINGYASDIVNISGVESTIPLLGDRSAWNAADYADRHTNDVDTATGIHHTLGILATQAAAGDHTHAANLQDPTALNGDLIYRHDTRVVGFIGDSITKNTPSGGTFPPPELTAALLTTDNFTVTADNHGQDDSDTSTWLPSDGSGYLTAAKASFASAGVALVHIMLGTNDADHAISAATYGSNLGTICTNLVAAGYQVMLSYPPWGNWDATRDARLVAYQAQIDALVNGSTILQGDQLAYDYFKAHPSELADAVHPNATGANSLAALWASAMSAAVQPLERLGIGASGDVLTVVAGLPAWQAPAADAADITYTPAVASDWNGSADPGNVNAALDQLAARIGSGGAINVYNETQTADGVSLTYYLANYAAESTIRVYIDGIRQPASDDSAATDIVMFDVAPDLGALLLFDYEMDTA